MCPARPSPTLMGVVTIDGFLLARIAEERQGGCRVCEDNMAGECWHKASVDDLADWPHGDKLILAALWSDHPGYGRLNTARSGDVSDQPPPTLEWHDEQ